MKLAAVSGITLAVSRIAAAEPPAFLARETLPGRGVWKPAVGRIDAVAKATGAKLYASDFRAADLPGWPAATVHALLVRAADATHTYSGFELARLSRVAGPSVVLTAADLERIGARVPEFYKDGDLFCPVGRTPSYLGQPVALLIFETSDVFDQARLALRGGDFLRYGAETGPVALLNYGAFRFVQVAGPTPDAPDIYSPLQEGRISPGFLERTGRPIWKPLPVGHGAEYVKGATYGEEICAQLAGSDPADLTLDRKFQTQSVDPMALEPERGLAWYDAVGRTLELVLGVQSPFEAATSLAFLLGEAASAFKPKHISAQFCCVGGGFGGRDHTPFPLHVALAAMFIPGHA
jgi:CO/xanthine dehydrogenase Mo-binding subunit